MNHLFHDLTLVCLGILLHIAARGCLIHGRAWLLPRPPRDARIRQLELERDGYRAERDALGSEVRRLRFELDQPVSETPVTNNRN